MQGEWLLRLLQNTTLIPDTTVREMVQTASRILGVSHEGLVVRVKGGRKGDRPYGRYWYLLICQHHGRPYPCSGVMVINVPRSLDFWCLFQVQAVIAHELSHHADFGAFCETRRLPHGRERRAYLREEQVIRALYGEGAETAWVRMCRDQRFAYEASKRAARRTG